MLEPHVLPRDHLNTRFRKWVEMPDLRDPGDAEASTADGGSRMRRPAKCGKACAGARLLPMRGETLACYGGCCMRVYHGLQAGNHRDRAVYRRVVKALATRKTRLTSPALAISLKYLSGKNMIRFGARAASFGGSGEQWGTARLGTIWRGCRPFPGKRRLGRDVPWWSDATLLEPIEWFHTTGPVSLMGRASVAPPALSDSKPRPRTKRFHGSRTHRRCRCGHLLPTCRGRSA